MVQLKLSWFAVRELPIKASRDAACVVVSVSVFHNMAVNKNACVSVVEWGS